MRLSWLGVAGWVVGKSDLNENPVVSLDLHFVNFLLDISGIQKNMTTTDLIAGAELESVELVSWGLVWQN